MSQQYFIRNWKFFIHRFYSPDKVKAFLVKKSGDTNQISNYTSDLSKYSKTLVFIPQNPVIFFSYIPFLLFLKKQKSPQEVLFFASFKQQKILKSLQLANYTMFYNEENFLFGSEEFSKIENNMIQEKFNLVITLEKDINLLKQYLAKKSGASLRLGINMEYAYPFINLCLKSTAGSKNCYVELQTLINHFKIEIKELEKASKDFTHGSIKDHSSSSDLATQNVILLNLDADINGKNWTKPQIINLKKILESKKHRILAIVNEGELTPDLKQLITQLDLKVATIHTSSIGFIEMLKQYKALITRNSENWHLPLNLGNFPTLAVIDKTSPQILPTKLPKALIISDDSSEISNKEIDKLLNSPII